MTDFNRHRVARPPVLFRVSGTSAETTGGAALPSRAPALIVDADEERQRRYAALLSEMGYGVEATTDGRVGLALALQIGRRAGGMIVVADPVGGLDTLSFCQLLHDEGVSRTTRVVVIAPEPTREIRELQGHGLCVVSTPVLPPDLITPFEGDSATASREPLEPSLPRGRRRAASNRTRIVVQPAVMPPPLRCPFCDAWLTYLHSHLGGPQQSEQWDILDCQPDCGQFRYRHRTKKLVPLDL